MNTPHNGSPLADVLFAISEMLLNSLGGELAQDVFLDAMRDRGQCVDCGAVDDLRTLSLIITNLPPANVPAHAIVGRGGSDILELALETLFDPTTASLTGFLANFGGQPGINLGPEHDMVVPLFSQEGELEGSGVISVFGLDDPDPGTLGLHWTVTGADQSVDDRIIELLNTSVGDATTFDADGFPSTQGGGGAASGFGLPNYGDLVSGIVIVDPPGGGTATPGAPLTVTVEPIDGFVPMHMIVYSRVESEFDDTPPFTVSLDIPVESIGDLAVGAIAFDANWNMAIAEEVVVQIDVSALLTGISFLPDITFMFSYAPDYQVQLVGSFDDGVDRDITSPVFGTTYQSLDPDIVTIDAQGSVTAVSLGIATVQATNDVHRATAQIFVESFSCLGDIDNDGTVGIVDFLALLAAWGPCDDPKDCPADLDGDGIVGITDFLILLANWGQCT